MRKNMTTAVADLSDLLKGIPSGAWVAISESKNAVMAYGPDAQEVLREAKERGEEHPLILRVPDHAAAMFF
jgi:tRNA A37 threonylcarbamoyladenosine synthetase subunit TsaC/SUA5/YrdC